MNRLSKYLVYAIGEIILVVIGILIALQVNNWNENRKLHAEEISYLKRIKQDLLDDKEYIHNHIIMAELYIKRNTYFLNTLWKEQKNIEDAFSLVDSIMTGPERIVIQNSTYEELKSSGKLNLISNVVLRDSLNNFYRSSEHLISEMNNYINYTQNLLSNVNFNLFKLHSRWTDSLSIFSDKRMFHPTDWKYLNNPADPKFKQIENLATQFTGKSMTEKEQCNIILLMQNNLLKEIDKELKLFGYD